jgi:membrane protein
LVALVGLFGQYPETTDAIFKMIRQLGPESAVDTFKHPVESVVRQKGGAGALLGIGLLGALWSASGYLGAFIRASNVIYGTDEGRPFWKLRPMQIVLTVILVLLTAAVALSLVASGSIAEAVGEGIGLGSTAVTIWDLAKWPVLAVIVLVIIGILYRVAPNVRLPSWRWLSPGAVLAIVIWVVASAAFAFYVSHLGSYNSTYGSLGAVAIFLVWLWLTNLAILLGAEFNAELERERELAGGEPAEDELQLEPKDTRAKSYSGTVSR